MSTRPSTRRGKTDKAKPVLTSPCTASNLGTVATSSFTANEHTASSLCSSGVLPSPTSTLLRYITALHPSQSSFYELRSDLSSLPSNAVIAYAKILPPLASYVVLSLLERSLRHAFFTTPRGASGKVYNDVSSVTLLDVFNVDSDDVECEIDGEDVTLKQSQCSHLIFDSTEDQSSYESCLLSGVGALLPLLDAHAGEQKMVEVTVKGKKTSIQPCLDIAQMGYKCCLRALRHLGSFEATHCSVKCYVGLKNYRKARSCLSSYRPLDHEEGKARDALGSKLARYEEHGRKKDKRLAKKIGAFVSSVMERNAGSAPPPLPP